MVVVLEAGEQVGRRILTFSDTCGRPEAGGSLIYADYRRLLEVAGRLDIELVDQVPRPRAPVQSRSRAQG